MPEVYTSKDANAPVLTNEKGSFNNLLKIVLTQGYGEKEAAGWTLAFEDASNDKVAFLHTEDHFKDLADTACDLT